MNETHNDLYHHRYIRSLMQKMGHKPKYVSIESTPQQNNVCGRANGIRWLLRVPHVHWAPNKLKIIVIFRQAYG